MMSANNYERTAKNDAGGLLWRYIFKPIADWRARQHSMNELMLLDDHTLNDIGIARYEIPGIIVTNVVLRRTSNANENLVQQSTAMGKKSEARLDDGRDRSAATAGVAG